MSARPGPYGGYHAEWYPYRDRQLAEAARFQGLYESIVSG